MIIRKQVSTLPGQLVRQYEGPGSQSYQVEVVKTVTTIAAGSGTVVLDAGEGLASSTVGVLKGFDDDPRYMGGCSGGEEGV